jgi:hypothetical protein
VYGDKRERKREGERRRRRERQARRRERQATRTTHRPAQEVSEIARYVHLQRYVPDIARVLGRSAAAREFPKTTSG